MSKYDFNNPEWFCESALAGMTLAVVGQGFVGKPLADWIEDDGPCAKSPDRKRLAKRLLRLDETSKAKDYAAADVAYVCVPTPFRDDRCDVSAVMSVIKKLRPGALAIVRSTLPPHDASLIAELCDDVRVAFAPEFLDEDTNRQDTYYPSRTVVGVRDQFASDQRLFSMLLPTKVGHVELVNVKTACAVKLASNGFFTVKNVFFNAVADWAVKIGANADDVCRLAAADPRIGPVHAKPVHKGGRGAGGKCLVKDYEMLRRSLRIAGVSQELEWIDGVAERNMHRLIESAKDPMIVLGVFRKTSEVDDSKPKTE